MAKIALTRPSDVPTVADAMVEFVYALQMATTGPVPGKKPKDMTPAEREKVLAWCIAPDQRSRAIAACGKLGEAVAWDREVRFWEAFLACERLERERCDAVADEIGRQFWGAFMAAAPVPSDAVADEPLIAERRP